MVFILSRCYGCQVGLVLGDLEPALRTQLLATLKTDAHREIARQASLEQAKSAAPANKSMMLLRETVMEDADDVAKGAQPAVGKTVNMSALFGSYRPSLATIETLPQLVRFACLFATGVVELDSRPHAIVFACCMCSLRVHCLRGSFACR
jgi:hypothetical protein